jgi:hypothetical protein
MVERNRARHRLIAVVRSSPAETALNCRALSHDCRTGGSWRTAGSCAGGCLGALAVLGAARVSARRRSTLTTGAWPESRGCPPPAGKGTPGTLRPRPQARPLRRRGGPRPRSGCRLARDRGAIRSRARADQPLHPGVCSRRLSTGEFSSRRSRAACA